MMRVIEVKNSLVVNVTVFPDDAELPQGYFEDTVGANIGWTVDANGVPQPPAPENSYSFEDAFDRKYAEIIISFKSAMALITDTYTAEDIASFPTQESEATAWQADNTSSTPLIDGLLANRPGIDKATLVQRIIDNAATYKAVAGPAIGKKQAYEDQLYALNAQHEDPEQPDVTQSDIDAIVIDFN